MTVGPGVHGAWPADGGVSVMRRCAHVNLWIGPISSKHVRSVTRYGIDERSSVNCAVRFRNPGAPQGVFPESAIVGGCRAVVEYRRHPVEPGMLHPSVAAGHGVRRHESARKQNSEEHRMQRGREKTGDHDASLANSYISASIHRVQRRIMASTTPRTAIDTAVAGRRNPP